MKGFSISSNIQPRASASIRNDLRHQVTFPTDIQLIVAADKTNIVLYLIQGGRSPCMYYWRRGLASFVPLGRAGSDIDECFRV